MKDVFNPEQRRRLMELAGISVDEIKLDTPELIRKYAGIPGSSKKHTGYNTPGTDPEFIWKNLPDTLVSFHTVDWFGFQSICKYGLGGVRGGSAKTHDVPGGFWFLTKWDIQPFVGEEWTDDLGTAGKLTLFFIISKNDLDPKKTYWDGESGGDENYLEDYGPWETDDLQEFWYNGVLPVSKCRIEIKIPTKYQGKVISPNISKEEFESLASSENFN